MKEIFCLLLLRLRMRKNLTTCDEVKRKTQNSPEVIWGVRRDAVSGCQIPIFARIKRMLWYADAYCVLYVYTNLCVYLFLLNSP